MRLSLFTFLSVATSGQYVLALDRRAPAGIATTNNVLELTTLPYASHHILPSSQHLTRRRVALAQARHPHRRTVITEDLLTLGGRIYMTNMTISKQVFAMVLDTGSSDTWVVSNIFGCEDPTTTASIAIENCNFGPLFDVAASQSFERIDHNFAVNYTDGEFLRGRMGTELVGFGTKNPVEITQTIGIVDQGWWKGDKISSGLLGMAFSQLAKGVNTKELNYTSFLFSLFKDKDIPAVFTMALERPSVSNPRAGGVIAIGGIPENIAHDGDWVSVPIDPIFRDVFAWYSIMIDGFDITPPPSQSKSMSSMFAFPFPKFPFPMAPSKTRRNYTQNAASVIIDSGTSLVYLPNTIADYIASMISPPARWNPVSQIYLAPCTAKAPKVGIIIAGKTFFIRDDDLMNRGPGSVGGPDVGARPGECALSIQRADDGTLVLGDTWMKNVVVAFDMRGGGESNMDGVVEEGEGGVVRIASRLNY